MPDFFVLPDGHLYAGRFLQGGPRIMDRDSTVDQLVAGLDGSHRAIEGDVSVGTGKRSQQGLVVGSIQQSAVEAKRNARAVFGKVNVPLPGKIECSAIGQSSP